LTGAQWALLEALAGRAEVTVSLPYEPGRPAFSSLERTAADLSELARPRIEELPARPEVRPPALAHLERALFSSTANAQSPEIDGAIRFFEGAGRRGTLERVAEELLALIRAGTAAEQSALVCPRVERYRAPLETALGSLGVPYAIEGRIRFEQTEFGRALLSLLRFAWQGGDRGDLYGFLRSPYSGLARASVDWVEGRLRGRAVETGERTEEETMRLRDGHPLPPLELVRNAETPLGAAGDLGRFMLRAAYGLDLPRHERSLRAMKGPSARRSRDWLAFGGSLTPDEIVSAWAGSSAPAVARARPASRRRRSPARADAPLRGRFILGLEEGSRPHRGETSPFLDEETARGRQPPARSGSPSLIPSSATVTCSTACTRPTRRLYLVREAASDEGGPREPSPFWDEVRDCRRGRGQARHHAPSPFGAHLAGLAGAYRT
jgi:hypothetical protein